jgi:hypothetical protein
VITIVHKEAEIEEVATAEDLVEADKADTKPLYFSIWEKALASFYF